MNIISLEIIERGFCLPDCGSTSSACGVSRFKPSRRLTWSELEYYWVKARRNGAIRMLDHVKRDFYNSRRLLAKAGGSIRSRRLISMLIEAGFDYVTTFNGIMLFRKRK